MSDSDRSKRTKAVAGAFCAIALLGSVVLAYLIGLTQGVSEAAQQSATYNDRQDAQQDALRACAGREGTAAVECVSETIEAAYQQSNSSQDLQAQQDMARWAFWMLIATLGTLGVTAIGVWFVKRTLDATLEAVEDTGEATEEMRKANRIADENAHRQVRAYLTVTKVTLDNPEWTDETETKSEGKLTMEFTNNGSTPAEVVSIYLTLHYITKGNLVSLMDFKSDVQFAVHRGSPTNVPLQVETDATELESKGHFFAFGRIGYKDVFNEKQEEMFCFYKAISENLFDSEFPLSMDRYSPQEYLKTMRNGYEMYLDKKGKTAQPTE